MLDQEEQVLETEGQEEDALPTRDPTLEPKKKKFKIGQNLKKIGSKLSEKQASYKEAQKQKKINNKNLLVTPIGQGDSNWEQLDPDNPYAVELSQS